MLFKSDFLSKKSIKILISLSVILLVVSGITRCNKPAEKKPQQASTPISTYTITTQQLASTETSLGVLSSLAAPMIKAETSGRIIKLYVDVGQSVELGQVLAEIDPTDTQSAVTVNIAQAAQLKAQLANQQLNVKRLHKLIKTKLIAQADFDLANSKLKTLQEQLKAINAQTDNAQYQLQRTKVVAPSAGKIQTRLVSAGDYIGAGGTLFQLVTLSPLRAALPFPETIDNKLKIGQQVRLTTPGVPNKAVVTTIKQLTPALESTNHSITALVDFANPGGWLPGASVEGVVTVKINQTAIMAPLESIVLRPEGAVVYIIKNNIAYKQQILTGSTKGNFIEVLQGLAAKTTIAKDGAGYLTDKAAVEIRNS